MQYRIFTENKNKKLVVDAVRRRFEGFTISEGLGYWQGSSEKTLIIDIDSLDDDNRLGVYKLAEEIKIHNKQEAVLLQIIGVKSILV